MPWTPEEARENARKGGLAKGENAKRRATMSPEERALEAIGGKLDKLSKELLDAALGEGDFEDLKKETRVAAILRAMEWRLGKPATVKPTPKDQPEQDDGLAIS